MAAVSREICCLCKIDVSSGTERSKRISIRGEAAKIAMDVLDSLANQLYDVNFLDNMEEHSFLCRKCRNKVEGLPKLVEKIRCLENDIKSNIAAVLGHLPAISRYLKRPASNEGQSGNVTKRMRPDVQEGNVEEQCQQVNDSTDTDVTVKISYSSGPRNYTISTPWRKETIKKLTRKSLRSFTSSVTSAEATSSKIIKQVVNNIKNEMKDICSDDHNSIIQCTDSNDSLLYFRWDRLFHELTQKMPVFVSLLTSLIIGEDNSRRVTLVCVIASMLLKNRFPKMALVQRAISLLLYGNGCSKEVYNCLQPLMLTMSHAGTIKVLNRLTVDHDISVHFWSHELLFNLKKRNRTKQAKSLLCVAMDQGDHEGILADDDDLCLTDDEVEPLNVADTEEYYGDEEQQRDIDNYDSVEDTDETSDMGGAIAILREVDTALEYSDELTEGSLVLSNLGNSDVQDKESNEDDNQEGAWSGFKIVGDNFDKNFRRTFQRLDYQTESVHYFHMYAVKDRVDLTNMSDTPRDGIIDIPQLLPNTTDHEEMAKNFAVLISRILVKYFTPFKEKAKSVDWHIHHKYSEEMKQKSTVIPLGIELRNENKTDEMCQILDSIHKYVPTITTKKSLTLPNGEPYEFTESDMWEILLGGDQLTVARARGAIDVRCTHESDKEKLLGVLPVVEDWHTRMTFLKVIWTDLYSTKSAADKGTLFQLKNVLNRSSVPNDPKNQMQATEDFFELILMSHVIIAAEKEYKDGFSLDETVEAIINKYIHLAPDPSKTTGNTDKDDNDLVHSYACKLLSLGMIWLNYYDAVREGDGHRVLRIWKYLMIVFKLTGHRNYAKEAALLLITYHFSSSERVAEQIITSRFINTKGREGCNIPCDLHLEHLNRRLKGVLTRMESNVSPACVTRAAKALRVVDQVCRSFRDELSFQEASGIHHKPSIEKDMKKVLDVLREKDIFENIPKRRHAFITKDHSLSILQSVKIRKIEDWIIDKIVPSFL